MPDNIVHSEYPQWTKGHTVLHPGFVILPRYCRSAYVQYASFQRLAESQIWGAKLLRTPGTVFWRLARQRNEAYWTYADWRQRRQPPKDGTRGVCPFVYWGYICKIYIEMQRKHKEECIPAEHSPFNVKLFLLYSENRNSWSQYPLLPDFRKSEFLK